MSLARHAGRAFIATKQSKFVTQERAIKIDDEEIEEELLEGGLLEIASNKDDEWVLCKPEHTPPVPVTDIPHLHLPILLQLKVMEYRPNRHRWRVIIRFQPRLGIT